ncbi:MAG: cytochrome c3 family protein, partial [Nannocystaceae bacterium]
MDARALRCALWGYLTVALLLGGVMSVRSAKLARAAPSADSAATPLDISPRGHATPRAPTRASAVYPARAPTVSFDHGVHLDLGLTCAPCHASATTSTRSADDLGVAADACDGCHETQHPWAAAAPGATTSVRRPATCDTCHFYDDDPLQGRSRRQRAALAPMLVFNHALHHRAGASCEGCHQNIRKNLPGTAHASGLPREESCLTCHDGKRASKDCQTCHPTDRTGRLQLAAGGVRGVSKLVPAGTHDWGMAHDLNFVERHGTVAGVDSARCAACHAEDECQECHAGAMRPLQI